VIWRGELTCDEIGADPGGHRAQEGLFATAREFEEQSLVRDRLCSFGRSDDEGARAMEQVRRVGGVEDAHDQDGRSLDLACRGEVWRQGVDFGGEELADVGLWVCSSRRAKSDSCAVVCDTQQEPAAEAICERSDGPTDPVTWDRLLSFDKEIFTMGRELLEARLIEIGQGKATDAIEHDDGDATPVSRRALARLDSVHGST
jgi:hypothetical protein